MPPSNAGYLYAAYTAAATVYGLYALTLWRRARRTRERLRELEGRDPR
jgi:hypothetical protein